MAEDICGLLEGKGVEKEKENKDTPETKMKTAAGIGFPSADFVGTWIGKKGKSVHE